MQDELDHLHRRVAELEAAEKAQRALTEQYRWLAENAKNGYALFEAVYNGSEPVDFVCIETNRAFEEIFGRKNLAGWKTSGGVHLNPDTDTLMREIFTRVVSTCVPEELPPNFISSKKSWLSSSVSSPREGLIALLIEDITSRVQAEKLLKNKENIEQFTQFGSEMICLHNLDRSNAWVSQSSTALIGYTPEELYHIPIFSLFHPDDLKDIIAPASQLAQSAGEKSTSEYRLRRKDGTYIWVETINQPIQDPDGKTLNLLTSTRDISERKRMEELTLLQRDLGLALAEKAGLNDILNSILEELLKIECIDCGGIYTVDQSNGDLDMVAYIGLPPDFVEQTSHYGSDTPNAKIISAGKPIYSQVPDFKLGTTIGVATAEGLRALAVIPIRHEGEVIAALNLASHTGDEIPANVRATLEIIASQIGSAIARAQIEEALRENEEKNRVFFENGIFSVYIIDAETQKIVDVNDVFFNTYGYDRSDIENGLYASDISNQPEQTRASIKHTLAAGTAFVPLRYQQKKDGTVFPTEIAGGSYTWKGRRVVYGMARDISVRIESEGKLARLTEELKKSQVHAKMGSWKYHVRENTLEISDGGYRILGLQNNGGLLTPKELVNRSFHPDDRESLINNLLRAVVQGYGKNHEYRVLHPDGSIHMILLETNEWFRGASGEVEILTGICQDITERRLMEMELERSEKRYREMVDQQGEGIIEVDTQAKIIFANPAAEELFGVQPGNMTGMNLFGFISPIHADILKEQLSLREKRLTTSYELIINRPDGETRNLLITGTPRMDDNNEIIGSLGVIRDISRMKLNEEKLRYTSTHDALTGLYNRAYYDEVLHQLELRSQFPVSMVMVDVDNLKLVNDTFGHHTGDKLIQTVSSILASSTRDTDTVARIGGDEFVLLLPKTDSSQLARVLERLGKNINRETAGGNHPFFISISVGHATATEKGSLEQAAKEADRMMYVDKAAKKAGQNKYHKIFP